jgi:hypothetical protein
MGTVSYCHSNLLKIWKTEQFLIANTVTGISETPLPLQLNIITSPCTSNHLNLLMCHIIHGHFLPANDNGIKHNLTFSWQKLWVFSVIWEVIQFSLVVRYQTFGKKKTCCPWPHLEDENSMFLQNTSSQLPNHMATYPSDTVILLKIHFSEHLKTIFS